MSLTASLSISLSGQTVVTHDLSQARDVMSLGISKALASGTGLNQVNRVFHDTRTLAAATPENIDVFDFGGALDPVGQALALSKIRLITIENKSTTVGNILRIGGEGSAAAWNSIFNGDDTATLDIPPGGILILVAPSLAAFAVADTTNHLLKIENLGATGTDYNIVVMGSQ